MNKIISQCDLKKQQEIIDKYHNENRKLYNIFIEQVVNKMGPVSAKFVKEYDAGRFMPQIVFNKNKKDDETKRLIVISEGQYYCDQAKGAIIALTSWLRLFNSGRYIPAEKAKFEKEIIRDCEEVENKIKDFEVFVNIHKKFIESKMSLPEKFFYEIFNRVKFVK